MNRGNPIIGHEKAREDTKKDRLNMRKFGFSAFLEISRNGEMEFQHINQLCDLVRETSFAIHRYHRHGHLEKVYENALAGRLRKKGLDVRQQHPLAVFDEDGTLLGEYCADLFIEQQLIVELKAVRVVADEHVAQLLGYLRSSKVEAGLLINYGAPVLWIKKYLMTDSHRDSRTHECL